MHTKTKTKTKTKKQKDTGAHKERNMSSLTASKETMNSKFTKGLATPQEYAEDMKKLTSYNAAMKTYNRRNNKFNGEYAKQFKKEIKEAVKDIDNVVVKYTVMEAIQKAQAKRRTEEIGNPPKRDFKVLDYSNAIIIRMKPYLSRNVKARKSSLLVPEQYTHYYNFLSALTDDIAKEKKAAATSRKTATKVARQRQRESRARLSSQIHDAIMTARAKAIANGEDPRLVRLELS